MDLDASQITKISGLNRNTTNQSASLDLITAARIRIFWY